MTGLNYDKITKYMIKATCDSSLHIGSGDDKSEILVHPVDGYPFIQASSITGVLRSAYSSLYPDKVDTLFGNDFGEVSSDNTKCRIKIEDGIFDRKTVVLEQRTHVKIDRKSGTVQTDNNSGQLFSLEYIGKGAKFDTVIYVFEDSKSDDNYSEDIKHLFALMKKGEMKFGSKKSSGAGSIILEKLLVKEFDLNKSEDRDYWKNEEDLDVAQYTDITNAIKAEESSVFEYKYIISGKTEDGIIVKSKVTNAVGAGSADVENFRNVCGEYIVPGSSFRGSIRNQMEKISEYLGKQDVIGEAFGVANESENSGKIGNLTFHDAVIGNIKDNDKAQIKHHVHIDKFTGGAIDGGLFTEKLAYGDIKFEIDIANKNNPSATAGLVLLAVRDLANKSYNFGSGYASGKGYIDVAKIEIVHKGETASIIYNDGKEPTVDDAQGIIKEMLGKLKEA